jgi:Glycosyltransferase family 87
LIVARSFEAYRVVFIIEMMLLNAGTVWLVARQVTKTAGVEQVPVRLAWYTLLFAALCPMIVVRFDLVPMLFAFVSVYLMSRGRMAIGGILAGFGTLAKLVPALVLLPIVVLAVPWRPRARAIVGFAATVGLGGFGWWFIGGERILGSFRYHSERGIEIGSLYAAAYIVAHKVAGVMIVTQFDHTSMNIAANGSATAASLSTIIQGACLLLVAWRARRDGPGHEFRYAAAALLAYMAFGKVLSPQYVIWLLPFVCVLDGQTGKLARMGYLICALLTSTLYPRSFHQLCEYQNQAVLVLVARNLALIGLFAILLGPTRTSPAAITPTQSSPEACS